MVNGKVFHEKVILVINYTQIMNFSEHLLQTLMRNLVTLANNDETWTSVAEQSIMFTFSCLVQFFDVLN